MSSIWKGLIPFDLVRDGKKSFIDRGYVVMMDVKKCGVVEFHAAKAQYAQKWDDLFAFISEKQLKDDLLWRLLIVQYEKKADDLDAGWRGEYWGKLMRGGAMVYAYTKDVELYQTLKNAVEGILTTQDEYGRISAYSKHNEFIGWDMWSRKYIMLGMQYFYEVCEDECLKNRMVSAMQKHADYIMEHVGDGAGRIPVRQTSDFHIGYNAFSILQPFVKLYKLTGTERYLAYAKEMIDSEYQPGGLFALAKENKLYPYEYPVTKAYELMSCFEGLLEYYEVVGDVTYLETAKGYADKILQTDFVIIGASGGHDEYFDHSTKSQVLKTDVNKFETCVTVTLMKYLATLYRLTGEKQYVDAIERSFYNAYLGALIDVENRGGLPVPLFYSYSPVCQNERWTLMGGNKHLSSYARFGCCVAIGAAGLGVIPTVGVVAAQNQITVGMFIDGTYQLPTATLRLETEYPYDGRVKLTLVKGNGTQKIALRIPNWCTAYTLDRAYTTENGYVYVELLEGETLTYEMEMPYQVHSSKTVNTEVDTLFAVTRGPIVLCADSCETDLYQGYAIKQENGVAVGEKTDNGYIFQLEDGKTITLREYSKTGKDYYIPREISVWLKQN